jgi:hypothetical protein
VDLTSSVSSPFPLFSTVISPRHPAREPTSKRNQPTVVFVLFFPFLFPFPFIPVTMMTRVHLAGVDDPSFLMGKRRCRKNLSYLIYTTSEATQKKKLGKKRHGMPAGFGPGLLLDDRVGRREYRRGMDGTWDWTDWFQRIDALKDRFSLTFLRFPFSCFPSGLC